MKRRPLMSGCLIVKDEEAFIGECLSRLWKAVDEIVVVDTGSTDATVDIARAMGARTFHHDWCQDFSAARNAALAHCRHPWIFVIDADELVDEETLDRLDELGESRADGYLIDVVNFPTDDNRRVVSKHLAIFRNDPRFRYEGAIHENLANSIARVGGKISYLPIRVEHHGYSEEIKRAKNKRERNRTIILQELRKQPTDALLNYYLAQEYYVYGELREAIKYYRTALRRVGLRRANFVPAAAVRLMLALWGVSRWDEAYEVLERYQAEYLDYTDLHFLDGALSRKLGDYQRAEGALLRALALGDANPAKYEQVHSGFGTFRAWMELGELYQDLGKAIEAFSAFSKSLQFNSQYAPAAARLARLALKHDAPQDVLRYLSRVADLENHGCAMEVWEAFYSVKAWDECQAVALTLAEDERRFKNALVSIGRGELDHGTMALLELVESDSFPLSSATIGVLVAIEMNDIMLARRFLDYLHHGEGTANYAVLADLVAAESGRGSGALPFFRSNTTHSRLPHAWDLVARSVRLGLTGTLERLGLLLASYGESPAHRALHFGKVLQREGFRDAATEQYLLAALDGVYDSDSLLLIVGSGIEAGYTSETVAALEKVIQLDQNRPLPYLLLARALSAMGERSRAREVLAEGRAANPYSSLLRVEVQESASRVVPER